MKIKVEPYLIKRGNKIAKAAVEFDDNDGFLAGFHLLGFTICEDHEGQLFVLFPASITKSPDKPNKAYFFLKPDNDTRLHALETVILDKYDEMMQGDNSELKLKEK